MLRPWHYSLVLDKDSPHSIHQQLTEHFRTMIEGGSWLGGSALPSSRDIAQRLGINRKTVSRVYEELSAQGLIYTQPKRGTFVSAVLHNTTTAGLHTPAHTHSNTGSSTPNNIQRLIQQSCSHYIRRMALHIHKLRPQDFDVTGLFDLKHMLANLLAHERRYLISPEHIACGTWPSLQAALLQNLNLGEGYLLIGHTVSASLESRLTRQGIAVLRLPEIMAGQPKRFIEQVEKYCINYPVAAIWCDSLHLTHQLEETEQNLVLQKLSDYHLLLIDDQRKHLPDLQNSVPLSAKYARSYLIGSLYGEHCDMFNLSYIASNLGFTDAFLLELNHEEQAPSLLNQLAQSELIKRGEYKKLLTTIQKFLLQTEGMPG